MARVLVIDDDKLICSTVAKGLLMAGFMVDGVTDGVQAMKLMELKGYDVVITDILMHKKGGYEIIREVKKNYPETKIIAISGGGVIDKKNILQSASKIGADQCVSKPFDFENLIETINKLTGEYHHRPGEGLSGSGLFDLR